MFDSSVSDALDNGERQVAASLGGIRRDHVARYEFAARRLPKGSRVLDIACGVGYGAFILAEAGHIVMAVDRSAAAIAYALKHYAHPNISHAVSTAEDFEIPPNGRFDAVVSFETIEHLENPAPVLKRWRGWAPTILASVPNEAVFPHRGSVKFHFRHYTRAELAVLLGVAGWLVTGWYGQLGPESEVEADVEGRTIVVTAERAVGQPAAPTPKPVVPNHVVILGLGPSLEAYVDHVKRLGSRRAFADEVWGINAVGDVIRCDRVFHLDSVEIQEARAAARPRSNIANMLTWMRTHPGPIYTSTIPDPNPYPGLVAYPLQDVINSTGYAYFNGTAAYVVAYALHIGVRRLSFYGCDYTMNNSHHAERGRSCLEWWLGIAAARGVEITVSDQSSLLDACEPDSEKFYGYDTVDVSMAVSDGAATIGFARREKIPTVEEIERRYNHERSPSTLVRRMGEQQ